MEFSNAAAQVVMQAQALREEGNQEQTLCVEHLFYGLLLLASYFDPPLDRADLRREAKAVRERLSEKMRSIESAKYQLKRDARDPEAGFIDATEIVGRAAEMADGADGTVDALCLLNAILESPTPTVLALMGLGIPACMAEDRRYDKKKPEPPVENDTPSLSQLMSLLDLLGALEERQNSTLSQNLHRPPNGRRQFTKIGLFTYRGGTVAAAIQYFLFGILVPLAVLVGLEHFTGLVRTPPTPFVGFLVGAVIVLWGFYLVRGATLLLGLASKAFGHFLDLMADGALLYALMETARRAYALPEIPTWMRIVGSVIMLLVLLIGTALYDHLSDEADTAKTKILFQEREGTPAKIFFQDLTRNLLVPFLLAAYFWISRTPLPVWAEKTFWILGYFYVWHTVSTLWTCLKLRSEASRRYRVRKGKGFVEMMDFINTLLLLPGLALLLHWLFGWFPMKVWVIILFGVYGLFFLVMCVAKLIQMKEES